MNNLAADIALQKQDIIQWINSLEDPIVISKLSQLKAEKQNSFSTQFEKCISADELKKKTTEFIQSLPWKK